MLIFRKKMLMLAKFSRITDNFYKFVILYMTEVAYQIWKYHILFKYKNGKKRFSIPHEFNRKTVKPAEKPPETFLCNFFNRNNDSIRCSYWLKFKKKRLVSSAQTLSHISYSRTHLHYFFAWFMKPKLFTPWDRGRLGTKLRTKHVIY